MNLLRAADERANDGGNDAVSGVDAAARDTAAGGKWLVPHNDQDLRQKGK